MQAPGGVSRDGGTIFLSNTEADLSRFVAKTTVVSRHFDGDNCSSAEGGDAYIQVLRGERGDISIQLVVGLEPSEQLAPPGFTELGASLAVTIER